MDFLKLIRFPNLIIIVIIQYILQYWILRPALVGSEVELLLTHNLFFLLVISTVIIAATGYIINDIVDIAIDKINKPHKMIVERIITKKHAWQLYWGLVIIGFLISVYVAYRIDNLPLVFIYPCAVSLLALYSYKLKSRPFSGNLVVALFSALVTGIILFAERASFTKLSNLNAELYQYVSMVFYGYMIFAVLTSLYREIVKDLEDIEGDKAQGCKTVPTLMGTRFSKILASIFGISTISLLVFWLNRSIQIQDYLALAVVTLFLTIPLLYSLIKLWSAADPKAYHHISTCIKGVMAGGIICLLLL